mmetsp:Transcript_8720/g.19577  ORF Transcript_8720/g.19577 Transcript_8720/m.19577 type:complete len:546 (+) Transcript_8720:160-1797(+)
MTSPRSGDGGNRRGQLAPRTPGPLSPSLNDEFSTFKTVRRRSEEMESASEESLVSEVVVAAAELAALDVQKRNNHRRLMHHPLSAATSEVTTNYNMSKKRTLVVYSGPTSLDRTIGKNDVYLTNFEYFIQNGIECHGLGGVDKDHSSQQTHQEQQFVDNNIQYVIVLTQDVADEYTGEEGLITKKQRECSIAQQQSHPNNNNNDPLVTVLIRQDKCYDMESILVVLRTFDVPHNYDHMVYINCGLAGPHFGPGSPVSNWEQLSSWTELYTSLLSDTVQMVGHTINTHFNTVYSPHVQSFLFAINTPMIDVWLETGAIYECGIANEDFKDDILRMALVWRYEVGISRVLLERGHSIAAAFMHQSGRIGEPLVIDANSTFGRNLEIDDIIHSDVFTEEGLRRLTESSFLEYDDRRKYAILPWDCYVFFKVSRLIPYDIQDVMQYNSLGPLELVPNDARRSSIKAWRRKAGVSFADEVLETVFRISYSNEESLKCHGRHCKFEKVAKTTGGVGVVMIVFVFLWYFATLKIVERRINLHRLKDLRRKWK